MPADPACPNPPCEKGSPASPTRHYSQTSQRPASQRSSGAECSDERGVRVEKAVGRPLEQGTRNRDPAPDVIEVVALVALRLAEAARNDAWIDFTIRVYASRNQPMPVAVVSGLCSLVAKLRGVDAMLLSSYLTAMGTRSPKLTAEQRAVLERLKGLQTVRCAPARLVIPWPLARKPSS
jgi:hypothetical protein